MHDLLVAVTKWIGETGWATVNPYHAHISLYSTDPFFRPQLVARYERALSICGSWAWAASGRLRPSFRKLFSSGTGIAFCVVVLGGFLLFSGIGYHVFGECRV